MTRLGIIFILMAYCHSIFGQDVCLFADNASKYSIIIPDKATEGEAKAATEFQTYFLKATGKQLPISTIDKEDYSIQIGNTKLSKKLDFISKIKDDGYAINTHGSNVYITSKTEKGVLYGVYGFLDKFLDIQLLTPGNWHITNQKKIIIPDNTQIIENPAFVFRDIYNSISYNPQYTDWHALTHAKGVESIWGLFYESFFLLVPPKVYFKTHPEYYALINNVRQDKKAQLCLSNPAVATKIIDTLKIMMARAKDKKYWFVGQEDMSDFCQCEPCQRLYKKYGNRQSGAVVEFINKIAAAFPDKIIGTFAYGPTKAPPLNIKPASNVLICYAPIEAFQQKSYEESADQSYATYLKQWSAITQNLMVWDYIDNYANYMIPYPTTNNFQKNIRFFKKNGVRYVYIESIFQQGGDLKELRTYLMSKLLWNPDINQQEIINDFCNKYYGAAAKYILQYMKAVADNVVKENDYLRFWKGTANYLKPEYLIQYDHILEMASQSVKNDSTFSERVNYARMPVDFCILNKYKIYSSQKNKEFTAMLSNGKEQRKQRFKNTALKERAISFLSGEKWINVTEYVPTIP